MREKCAWLIEEAKTKPTAHEHANNGIPQPLLRKYGRFAKAPRAIVPDCKSCYERTTKKNAVVTDAERSDVQQHGVDVPDERFGCPWQNHERQRGQELRAPQVQRRELHGRLRSMYCENVESTLLRRGCCGRWCHCGVLLPRARAERAMDTSRQWGEIKNSNDAFRSTQIALDVQNELDYLRHEQQTILIVSILALIFHRGVVACFQLRSKSFCEIIVLP